MSIWDNVNLNTKTRRGYIENSALTNFNIVSFLLPAWLVLTVTRNPVTFGWLFSFVVASVVVDVLIYWWKFKRSPQPAEE